MDHLTRITADRRHGRADEIGRALAGFGFTVREERRTVVADSTTVEAQEAKRRLRALGFADREYQVFLEYVRQWGVL